MGFCRSRIHRTCRNDFDAHVDQRLLEPYLTSLIIRMSLTMITFERFASIWFTCIVFIEIHLKMVRTIVNLMHMYVWACFLDLHNRGILKVRAQRSKGRGGLGGAPNPSLDLAPSSPSLSFLCPTEGRAPLSSFEILFAHFCLKVQGTHSQLPKWGIPTQRGSMESISAAQLHSRTVAQLLGKILLQAHKYFILHDWDETGN